MPESAQPAPDTDEKKSRGLGSYVLWAFVAVMVYVLSSGPVMTLAVRHPTDRRILAPYRPLIWLYWRPAFHKPLQLYWHLWCPKTFPWPEGRIPDDPLKRRYD
jgi:hypothetical protein